MYTWPYVPFPTSSTRSNIPAGSWKKDIKSLQSAKIQTHRKTTLWYNLSIRDFSDVFNLYAFSNSFYLHNVVYLQWKRGRHLNCIHRECGCKGGVKKWLAWHQPERRVVDFFFWIMRTNESFTITTGTCIKEINCDSMLALINSTVFPAAS